MIAGLEDITSGELRIDGVRVNETAPRDRDIAMVFQNYALYPHMTVRRNIEFPLSLARPKLPREEIDAKVAQVSAILGSTITSTASPHSCRAGSASAWRWAGRSCARPRPSSWTSR